MAKKENVQKFTPEIEEKPTDELLYESDAYGSPQPDAGMETTVMKTVGIGGPVPIVAPKHNTVQLQPIIVPLAVVPYMTQDSDVLRTDGREAGAHGGYNDDDNVSDMQATKTKKASKKAKSGNGKKRVASLVLFLLSAALVVGFLLAYFKPEVIGLNLKPYDIITIIKDWIGGIAPSNLAIALLYIIGAGFAALSVIVSLISLLAGKLPAGLLSVMAFCSAATIDAAFVYEIISKGYSADEKAKIVMVAIATTAFILALIFAVAISKGDKRRNNSNDKFNYMNEI